MKLQQQQFLYNVYMDFSGDQRSSRIKVYEVTKSLVVIQIKLRCKYSKAASAVNTIRKWCDKSLETGGATTPRKGQGFQYRSPLSRDPGLLLTQFKFRDLKLIPRNPRDFCYVKMNYFQVADRYNMCKNVMREYIRAAIGEIPEKSSRSRRRM